MLYTDARGVHHRSKTNFILGNLGVNVPGVDISIPDELRQAEDETVDVIEVHDDVIVGKSKDGKIITSSPVNDILLYGLAKDLIQDSLHHIEPDLEKRNIDELINSVFIDQGESVTVISENAKLNVDGTKVSVDLNMDQDVIERMAAAANNALQQNPSLALKHGKDLFAGIFTKMMDAAKLRIEKNQ